MYIFFPIAVCALILFYARKYRFDNITVALILLATALCYVHFYTAKWEGFSIDADAHMHYVQFIAEQNKLPTTDDTPAARHPPVYYIVCAALYKLAKVTHSKEPLLVTRHFSMVCYVMFLLLSVVLLRAFLSPPHASYYVALALLLFWPLGITMGGRITCDLLLYPGIAGVLCSLALWIQHKNRESLRAAFIWGGIAVLAKNTGIPILVLPVVILAMALYKRKPHERRLLTWDMVLAIIFALAACGLTIWHGWIINYVPIKQTYNLAYWLRWFTSFNLFVFIYETHTGLGQDSFWNVMVQSLLVGNALPWKVPNVILVLLNIAWLAVIAYMAEGLIFHFKRLATSDKKVLQMLGIFTGGMIVAMMFMSVATGNVGYADARYLYPVVAIVALCYGMVMQQHERAGARGACIMGAGFGLSIVLLTVALIACQYASQFITYY